MSYTVAEERMQDAIEELEQENRLLRARNERLEAEVKAAPVQKPKKGSYEAVFGHLDMTPDELGNYMIELQEKAAQQAPVQEPLIPEGWCLVTVTGFDQLMYWLDRCEHKGHLENCPDLIEPYEAFDYRLVTTPPAAKRQWVGLTEEQKLSLEIQGGKSDVMLAELIESWLKDKNT